MGVPSGIETRSVLWLHQWINKHLESIVICERLLIRKKYYSLVKV